MEELNPDVPTLSPNGRTRYIQCVHIVNPSEVPIRWYVWLLWVFLLEWMPVMRSLFHTATLQGCIPPLSTSCLFVYFKCHISLPRLPPKSPSLTLWKILADIRCQPWGDQKTSPSGQMMMLHFLVFFPLDVKFSFVCDAVAFFVNVFFLNLYI